MMAWYCLQWVHYSSYLLLRPSFAQNLLMHGKAFVIFLAVAQTEFGAETVDPAVLNRALALNIEGSAIVRQRRYAEAESRVSGCASDLRDPR